MKDKAHSDDWRTLCELASKENNPQKLLHLLVQINRALEECNGRSQNDKTGLKTDTVLLPIDTIHNDLDFYSCSPEYDC